MRHAWDDRPVLYLTMIIRSKPRIATCAQLGLVCVALARLLKATLHLLGKLIETPLLEHDKTSDSRTLTPGIDPLLREVLSSAQKLHKDVFPEAVQFTRASGAKAEDWAAALSVAGLTLPKAVSTGLTVPPEGPVWAEGLVSKPQPTDKNTQLVANCRYHFRRCQTVQRVRRYQHAAGQPSGPLSLSSPPAVSSVRGTFGQNPKGSEKHRLPQKDVIRDLDSRAEAALKELPENQRDLVEGLRKAAVCSDASLTEIASNLVPLLVARKRLQDVMKAYSDGALTATDKSTPWERCPWKSEAASDAGETPRFHLLAHGTDVADLAIERLPESKQADQRIQQLTSPVRATVYMNGTWQFGDQRRPGSAGAASPGRLSSQQRPKSSGPCPPSLNGRTR